MGMATFQDDIGTQQPPEVHILLLPPSKPKAVIKTLGLATGFPPTRE